jgi:hypothetical protein
MKKGTYKRTKEIKSKMSKSHIGIKHTEETKRKMSESRIGIYCGEDNPMYGTHASKETKEKMRKKTTKRWKTKEFRDKIKKRIHKYAYNYLVEKLGIEEVNNYIKWYCDKYNVELVRPNEV